MTPVAVHHRLGLLLQFYLSLRTVFFFSAMGNTISTQCEADTWNLRSYFCLFSWLSFSSGAAEFPGSRDWPSDVPLADRLSGGPSLCPWSPVYLHWQHSSFHFFLLLLSLSRFLPLTAVTRWPWCKCYRSRSLFAASNKEISSFVR